MLTHISVNDDQFSDVFDRYCRRNQIQLASEPLVDQILEDVRRRGDAALSYWTQKLDGVTLRPGKFSTTPGPQAIDKLEPELRDALVLAAERIRDYHARFVHNDWLESDSEGVRLGAKYTPIERVGIYVPGGTASLFSTILMCGIPAQVAGVKEIVMVTPPKHRHLPYVIEAAAHLAGVDQVFTVGGAQAIAALAFGTQSVPKVDKIVGPGNRYVAEAKRLVFGLVDIESIAGPSEVCIIADDTANTEWVAADAIAQAEHDRDAAVLILTTNPELANGLDAALRTQLSGHPRKDIAEASLRSNGLVVLCDNLNDAIQASNTYAPEHLELCVENPDALLPELSHAGAIFMGHHTPEAVGDYLAGPNHVLPTQGTARYFSPLGVEDFVKRTSLMEFSADALASLGNAVVELAEEEALPGHANSVRVRLDSDSH